MHDYDTLRRFIFENGPVRGEIVQLSAAWRAVLERHDYPPAVRAVLGEFIAAAVLLSGTIKFNGTFTMQIRGAGPITMLVAECTAQRTLRGIARWSGDVPSGSLREITGAGQVVITIDPGNDMERYQGIVELEGDNIAAALGNYLQRSEQLKTQLILAADENVAAGLLLQKLPESKGYGEEDTDLWDRVVQLAATLTAEELIRLPVRDILRRLFHEEDVRLYEAEPVSFRCTCSRDRVRNMLRALGAEEVHEVLREQGAVTVTCEYCNQPYQFDPVDVEQIFADEVSFDITRTRH